MRKTGENENNQLSLIRYSFIGAAMGILLTLLLIFVFAVIITTGKASPELTDTFVLLSVVAGAALGGAVCAGRQGRGVITAGLATAAVYIAIVLLVTFAMANRSDAPALTLKVIIASVAGGVFGGVLRLNRKKKKTRIKK
ncbi:MAG: TIGR04086 family membrane protein [Oscillospiraceae bacterium]